jgi:hypothetical protein
MKISFFKIINYLSKNKIKDVYFVDSFGGFKNFFNLYEQFNSKNNAMIICNNKRIYLYLCSIKEFKNFVFYYDDKIKLLLKNYFFLIHLILLKIFCKKVNRIFCYKLISDPLRFYLINIICSKKTKIYVSDQFYKFYSFKTSLSKNYKLSKKILIFLINIFCNIKLQLYRHLDLENEFYPAINRKYQFKCKNNSWQFYKKKYFIEKINIKKNSLIIIDETISLLIEKDWLDMKDFSENFRIKFSKFLKRHRIKNIYYKSHPTSEIKSFILKQIDLKKINFLNQNFPIEFILDDFNYCIFSISSSLAFTRKVKLYHLSDLLKFKKEVYKKKYENLLKKNIGKNYLRITNI